jgi:hypothetical protein
MKRGYSFLAVLVIFSLVSGCAWVTSDTVITKDKEGKVVESKYSRNIKGFSHDPETAYSWARADKTARANNGGAGSVQSSTSEKGIVVVMKNKSSFPVQIASGEFAGLVLDPGETSDYERVVPFGAYVFKIKFVKNGGLGEKEVVKMITPTTSAIVLIDTR